MIEIYALKLTEQLHRPVENFSVGNGIIGLCAKKEHFPQGLFWYPEAFLTIYTRERHEQTGTVFPSRV